MLTERQQDILYQEQMKILSIENEYKLFSMLKPVLSKVPDGWSCSYENKIVGFGKTPYKAILDWDNKMKYPI
ncbi:MAG: hypothetical protein M0R48_11490 [Candidatus Omnitrophica bacterium]|nr:hypothetical protein [Candidatus Omnitrophota bacterium]